MSEHTAKPAQLSFGLAQATACVVCQKPFEVTRQRGRPKLFCSDDCRREQQLEQQQDAGKNTALKRPLTARHRAFARLLACGEKPIAAYATAGFVPKRGNCSRLAKDPKIIAEVARLRGSSIQRAPDELNPKQRAFARGLAFGLEPDVAYERAGYVRHRHNGKRLAELDAVQREVDRLRREDQGVIAFVQASDASLVDRALKSPDPRVRDAALDMQASSRSEPKNIEMTDESK